MEYDDTPEILWLHVSNAWPDLATLILIDCDEISIKCETANVY